MGPLETGTMQPWAPAVRPVPAGDRLQESQAYLCLQGDGPGLPVSAGRSRMGPFINI